MRGSSVQAFSDSTSSDGSGSWSIYGTQFADENFTIKHTKAGLLSMANSGPNTNGCQFFITTVRCDCSATLTRQAPAEFLDGKHTVFGRVIEHGNDMIVLRKIENVPTGPNNRPKLAVGSCALFCAQLTRLQRSSSAASCDRGIGVRRWRTKPDRAF